MNRSSASLVTLALLIVGISGFSEVVAQTAARARVIPIEPVTIAFRGLNALDQVVVNDRLEKRGIVLSKSHLPNPDVVTKAAEIVKELLQSRGYTQATVDVLTNQEARKIEFEIQEGPRLPLALKFSGNRIFSGESLSASIQTCVDEVGKSSVEFDYCLRRVTDLMRNLGYLQARVGEPAHRVTSTELIITVPVIEGPLFRIGKIKIDGAESVPEEQIRSKFALVRGDIASGTAIGKWLFEDVKQLYGDLGYIEYTVEVQPVFRKVAEGAIEGVADFEITIDEGRLFRLSSIEFQGKDLPAKEMRKLFPLKDGEAFSQQQFEAGIKRLNESGWLEVIDKYADCDYKTDAEQGLVAIVIKARAKSSSSSVSN